MSTRTDDETRSDGTADSDCVALELEDGQVIIYDPGADGAWIQSDVAYPVGRDESQEA